MIEPRLTGHPFHLSLRSSGLISSVANDSEQKLKANDRTDQCMQLLYFFCLRSGTKIELETPILVFLDLLTLLLSFFFFFVRLVFFCSSPLSSPLFLFFFARLPLSIGAGNGQQYGPWGAAFNGETSLPLMPKPLPRKKTTNTCLPKRLRFQISKVAFNLVLGILVILQSCPWLKYNWILAFRHLLQTSP